MTNNTIQYAIQRIKELNDQGLDLKKIRAHLVIEDYTNKVIEDAIKELGLTQKRTEGLTQVDILAYFEEDARTENDLYRLVYEKGVTNECRWVKDRNKIRLLTISIYRKGGYDFIEVPATKELKDLVAQRVANKTKPKAEKEEAKEEEEVNPKVKEAWDKLNKAKDAWAKGKAPRNKNTFHPDKVHFLGDEALEMAYTKFFQDLTG